jgi:hypothetical protein
MSQVIEMPDSVYSVLQRAAEAEGTTPVGWISSRLAAAPASTTLSPRSLAELFAGRVGKIASGGRGDLSEDTGRRFGEYLEAKKRAGQL